MILKKELSVIMKHAFDLQSMVFPGSLSGIKEAIQEAKQGSWNQKLKNAALHAFFRIDQNSSNFPLYFVGLTPNFLSL
jgi:hypothetical protein